MPSEADLRRWLEPFELSLTDQQVGQVIAYLELLLRWNEKINLTSLREPAECVRRHFGESLYLGRWVELEGKLLDIGSGAGFPGLCLKILFPDLSVTLLEPVAKKRAFLKEAARVCGLRGVEVRRERLEDFARGATCLGYDAATARAVGRLEALIPQAARCLREGGELFLWLSRAQINTLDSSEGEVARVRILAAPGGGQGGIWWGRKAEGST